MWVKGERHNVGQSVEKKHVFAIEGDLFGLSNLNYSELRGQDSLTDKPYFVRPLGLESKGSWSSDFEWGAEWFIFVSAA